MNSASGIVQQPHWSLVQLKKIIHQHYLCQTCLNQEAVPTIIKRGALRIFLREFFISEGLLNSWEDFFRGKTIELLKFVFKPFTLVFVLNLCIDSKAKDWEGGRCFPFQPPRAVTLHTHISLDSHIFSNHVPENSFRRPTKPCFVHRSRVTSCGMRKTNSQHTVIPPWGV